MSTILASLAGGGVKEACRAAARWCVLSKAHRDACNNNSGAWETLARRVFPDGQWARPNDGTTAKSWFFYLCTTHQHELLRSEAQRARRAYNDARAKAWLQRVRVEEAADQEREDLYYHAPLILENATRVLFGARTRPEYREALRAFQALENKHGRPPYIINDSAQVVTFTRLAHALERLSLVIHPPPPPPPPPAPDGDETVTEHDLFGSDDDDE